jgi:ABC-type sugar transport system ATPase subunit
MSDRIVVMHEGAVVGELSRAEATQERVLDLASHSRPAPGEQATAQR